MKISISYDKGGYNYFNSKIDRRGVYVHFKPVLRQDTGLGFRSERCTITGNVYESGFKVFLKELGRRSEKQENHFFELIEPNKEKFAQLWNEYKLNEIYDMVQTIINK